MISFSSYGTYTTRTKSAFVYLMNAKIGMLFAEMPFSAVALNWQAAQNDILFTVPKLLEPN
jgi:hypothetical protein